MSDYSYEGDYSYDESTEQDTQATKNNQTLVKPAQTAPRIQFEQQSGVTLNLGQTGQVQINPGPDKTLQIIFTVNEGDVVSQLALSVVDGNCSINMMPQTGSALPVQPAKVQTQAIYDQIYKKIE